MPCEKAKVAEQNAQCSRTTLIHICLFMYKYMWRRREGREKKKYTYVQVYKYIKDEGRKGEKEIEII